MKKIAPLPENKMLKTGKLCLVGDVKTSSDFKRIFFPRPVSSAINQ